METRTPHPTDGRPEVETTSRRSLLGWLAALPLLGAAFPVLRALRTPATGDRPDAVFLCNASDVPREGLLARNLVFEVRRGPELERVVEPAFVGRSADGEIYAMSGICPHLGCPVRLADDNAPPALRCPCHEASFDREGRVLDGPPKRPLRRLQLRLPDEPSGPILVLDP